MKVSRVESSGLTLFGKRQIELRFTNDTQLRGLRRLRLTHSRALY